MSLTQMEWLMDWFFWLKWVLRIQDFLALKRQFIQREKREKMMVLYQEE